jgi:hypothetical protein
MSADEPAIDAEQAADYDGGLLMAHFLTVRDPNADGR